MTHSESAKIRPKPASVSFRHHLAGFLPAAKHPEQAILSVNNIIFSRFRAIRPESGHSCFEAKKPKPQLRQRNDTPISPTQ